MARCSSAILAFTSACLETHDLPLPVGSTDRAAIIAVSPGEFGSQARAVELDGLSPLALAAEEVGGNAVAMLFSKSLDDLRLEPGMLAAPSGDHPGRNLPISEARALFSLTPDGWSSNEGAPGWLEAVRIEGSECPGILGRDDGVPGASVAFLVPFEAEALFGAVVGGTYLITRDSIEPITLLPGRLEAGDLFEGHLFVARNDDGSITLHRIAPDRQVVPIRTSSVVTAGLSDLSVGMTSRGTLELFAIRGRDRDEAQSITLLRAEITDPFGNSPEATWERIARLMRSDHAFPRAGRLAEENVILPTGRETLPHWTRERGLFYDHLPYEGDTFDFSVLASIEAPLVAAQHGRVGPDAFRFYRREEGSWVFDFESSAGSSPEHRLTDFVELDGALAFATLSGRFVYVDRARTSCAEAQVRPIERLIAVDATHFVGVGMDKADQLWVSRFTLK